MSAIRDESPFSEATLITMSTFRSDSWCHAGKALTRQLAWPDAGFQKSRHFRAGQRCVAGLWTWYVSVPPWLLQTQCRRVNGNTVCYTKSI